MVDAVDHFRAEAPRSLARGTSHRPFRAEVVDAVDHVRDFGRPEVVLGTIRACSRRKWSMPSTGSHVDAMANQRDGRGGGIRTHNLVLPKHVRYRCATPRRTLMVADRLRALADELDSVPGAVAVKMPGW